MEHPNKTTDKNTWMSLEKYLKHIPIPALEAYTPPRLEVLTSPRSAL